MRSQTKPFQGGGGGGGIIVKGGGGGIIVDKAQDVFWVS